MYTKSKDKFKNKLKGLTSKEALERLNKDGFIFYYLLLLFLLF